MRWIFRLLGVVLLVAAVAVGALFFLPRERIAAIAADQVRAQTGRDLAISGDLSVSLWPVLGVTTGPVALSNADWAGDAPMVEAAGLSVGVDPLALFGGEIRIRHIDLDRPVLRLATGADGKGNWVFDDAAAGQGAAETGPDAGGTSGATPAAPTLDTLTMTGGRIVYAAAGAAPLELSIATMSLAFPDAAGPARIAADFALGGDALSLTAEIGAIAAALQGGVVPVEGRLATASGSVAFGGRASLAGDAAIRFDLRSEDTAAFMAALGQPGISVPQGAGRVLAVAGEATFTGGDRLALRDMSVTADGNAVTGDADILLSNVPEITARLAAGDLDLAALASGGDDAGTPGAAGTAPAGAGWPTEAIDASALGLINGTISLTANSIDTGTVKLGPSRLQLSIDRSRAVLALREVSVFGGRITGELVANNRSGLSVGGRLDAAAIEMQSALSDLAGVTRLSGKAGARLEFLGSGNSVDAIMRSLSGAGALDMAEGQISGIDLDRLMRTGDGSGGTTVFDSLAASYAITGGVLTNEDLLLLLRNFRAEGEGRIGLGAQDIDYLFTPIALRVNSGQGLAIPIRIRGPWSAPRIIPDLDEMLQLDVDGKVEEVKQETRQRVQTKIEEELDGPLQEGQSVEDAVKDRLEDKAKEGLLNLFNRN